MSQFSDEEIEELASIFPPGPAARAVLEQAEFPASALPSMIGVTGFQFWSQISDGVKAGIFQDGRAQILAAALRWFPYNTVLQGGRANNLHEAPRRLRVLVVGAGFAAPGAMNGSVSAIRADQESRQILQAQELGHLEVEVRPAATIDDVTFNQTRPPDIFHLICHGDRETLLFADEHGDPRRIPAARVARLIAAYGVHLSGIVLNACYSGSCAEAFAPHADTVIAHSGPLDDDCARLFASRLYRTLRDVSDFADAAGVAAGHLAEGEAQCPEIRTGLVVFRKAGGC
jgi:hypothetical protein